MKGYDYALVKSGSMSVSYQMAFVRQPISRSESGHFMFELVLFN
jgi:hypothetical protein